MKHRDSSIAALRCRVASCGKRRICLKLAQEARATFPSRCSGTTACWGSWGCSALGRVYALSFGVEKFAPCLTRMLSTRRAARRHALARGMTLAQELGVPGAGWRRAARE